MAQPAGDVQHRVRLAAGGLYEFSTGEEGVTFRLPGRGTVVVTGTTLTWTPETGTNSQTATLIPLPED